MATCGGSGKGGSKKITTRRTVKYDRIKAERAISPAVRAANAKSVKAYERRQAKGKKIRARR